MAYVCQDLRSPSLPMGIGGEGRGEVVFSFVTIAGSSYLLAKQPLSLTLSPRSAGGAREPEQQIDDSCIEYMRL